MTKKEKEAVEQIKEHIQGQIDALDCANTKEEVHKIGSELRALWPDDDWRNIVKQLVSKRLSELGSGGPWRSKMVGTPIRYKPVSNNLLGILGTAVGIGVTAAFFGGGHLGMSIGGKGYDMGPAWLWGGAAGGAIGHAGDHIRKSRRVK